MLTRFIHLFNFWIFGLFFVVGFNYSYLFCSTKEMKKIETKKTFIVSQNNKKIKKMSKNKLKENIGCQVRDVLKHCSNLNKHIGKLQIQIAEVEQQLFEKIEKLIDNKVPFKKASKGVLTNSFNIISSVNRELGLQVDRIKNKFENK
ncbi:hypothetical protein ACFLYH_01910 [Candidatus Dependentiae bacterium]